MATLYTLSVQSVLMDEMLAALHSSLLLIFPLLASLPLHSILSMLSFPLLLFAIDNVWQQLGLLQSLLLETLPHRNLLLLVFMRWYFLFS